MARRPRTFRAAGLLPLVLAIAACSDPPATAWSPAQRCSDSPSSCDLLEESIEWSVVRGEDFVGVGGALTVSVEDVSLRPSSIRRSFESLCRSPCVSLRMRIVLTDAIGAGGSDSSYTSYARAVLGQVDGAGNIVLIDERQVVVRVTGSLDAMQNLDPSMMLTEIYDGPLAMEIVGAQ